MQDHMFCSLFILRRQDPDHILGIRRQSHSPAEEHGDIYEDSNLRCLIFKNALALYEFMHSLIRQKPVSRNIFYDNQIQNPDAHREHNQIEAVRLRDGVKAAEARIEDKKIDKKDSHLVIDIQQAGYRDAKSLDLDHQIENIAADHKNSRYCLQKF